MYYRRSQIENVDQYKSIVIDNKTFYYKEERRLPRESIMREKDTFRKLNMIKKFKDKNIEEFTEKYKNCIVDCLQILKKEFNLDIKPIYKYYNLKKYISDIIDIETDTESI